MKTKNNGRAVPAETATRSASFRRPFGKMIEEAAREQGVSVAELARALGKKWGWVPQVFKGKNITEKTFRNCARALGLELCVELVPSEAAKKRIEARRIAEQAQPPRLRARRQPSGRE